MPAARRYLAEVFATFTLVFSGCGAIVIDGVARAEGAAQGPITHLGIAIVFGLVVLAMIYTVGDVSGAHMNPAVTIAFAVARRFEWRDVAPYIGAQVAGAIAACALLRVMFPTDELLGATLPRGGAAFQSFTMEIVLTCILMYVILNVSTGAKEKGITAGGAIGAVIAFEALFAGPISGASMNPARSLAPALVSGHVEHLWVYLVAPVIGAVIAIPMCAWCRGNEERGTWNE